MAIVLRAGRVVLPHRELVGGWVKIEAGKIAALGTGPAPEPAVDLGEFTLIPGLIDLHVHGAMGADTMDATAEALKTMAEFFGRSGVTGFLPTTMSAAADAVAQAVANVGKHVGTPFPNAARILGVHVEGPFIASEYRGAQVEKVIRPATREEVDELYGLLPAEALRL